MGEETYSGDLLLVNNNIKGPRRGEQDSDPSPSPPPKKEEKKPPSSQYPSDAHTWDSNAMVLAQAIIEWTTHEQPSLHMSHTYEKEKRGRGGFISTLHT